MLFPLHRAAISPMEKVFYYVVRVTRCCVCLYSAPEVKGRANLRTRSFRPRAAAELTRVPTTFVRAPRRDWEDVHAVGKRLEAPRSGSPRFLGSARRGGGCNVVGGRQARRRGEEGGGCGRERASDWGIGRGTNEWWRRGMVATEGMVAATVRKGNRCSLLSAVARKKRRKKKNGKEV